jgi:hypothetical protein
MPEAELHLDRELLRHIDERLAQHRDNLGLWTSGYLAPTEPDPEARRLTVECLKAAIYELKLMRTALTGREDGPCPTPLS